MSEEWLGIVSLAILFTAIFIGFPIAFTLVGIALGVGYFALGPIALHLMTIQFFSVMKEKDGTKFVAHRFDASL